MSALRLHALPARGLGSPRFYLYEFARDTRPSLAQAVLDRVSEVCPIDLSETIDGWPASGGVVRPNLEPRDRPEWAEAAYLVMNKTGRTYTLEAPRTSKWKRAWKPLSGESAPRSTPPLLAYAPSHARDVSELTKEPPLR